MSDKLELSQAYKKGFAVTLLNVITFGDAFDLLPSISDASVDLIFSDPPYVTALKDLNDWNQGLDFGKLAEQFDRVLSNVGQICLFCDAMTFVEISNAFKDKFRFRFYYVWIKSSGQPVNGKMPISNVEIIGVWAKKSVRIRDLTYNPQMMGGTAYRKLHRAGNLTRKKYHDYTTDNLTGDRYPVQTLFYPSKDNLPTDERTPHPTQKPLGLVGYLIQTLSNVGDLVCDPFAGSGSIPIACHRLNRRFVAFEREKTFFQMASERLKIEKSQTNLFEVNP